MPSPLFALSVPIFSQLVELVATFLRFLRDHTGGNLGVAIILFTLLIKSLLAPLTFKSIKSSKAMQDIAPALKALQKKHGDDKQAFAAAQMELYQEYGINPLAGCLPVLIQLPVFLIVYNAVREVATHDTVGVQFLWVTDLTKTIGSTPAGQAAFHLGPFGGQVDPFRILVFLAFIFQVIQTRMSQPNAAKRAQQDQQTRTQSLLITVSTSLVLFFGWNFIAAMVLYWAIQAVYSAVQQYFITGWGALSDIFPFLPVKVEKPRPVLERREPGKQNAFSKFMAMGLAQERERRTVTEETPETVAEDEVRRQQQLRADGRPKPGSNLSISGRAATPPQKKPPIVVDPLPGEANGNRPAARSKGAPQKVSTARAIGMAETTDTGEGTTRLKRVNGANGANGTNGARAAKNTNGATGSNGAIPPAPRKTNGGKVNRPAAGSESAGGGGE